MISPEIALKRAAARKTLEVFNQGYGNHGASSEKSSMRGFKANAGSVLEDVEEHVTTLRERSRDLYMGAPIANGALKSMVTNIVGAGLKLNTQIDYEFLKMTSEEADAWETHVEREFRSWARSTNCDITRMNNFYELQQLAFLSQLMSGDCFVLLPMVKRINSPYELTLQILEADRVCNPDLAPSLTSKLVNGVEIDGRGEVIAYYIADNHPYSTYNMASNKWKRITKYGLKTGRPNVLHLMEMERPEQRRGIPIVAPVIETLKQLTRYTEAELMAAVISSMFTVFVQKEAPPKSDFGGISSDEQLDDDDDTLELGNGLINFLQEGESVTFANPTRPNTGFDSFIVAMCRQIGVALEIPYEVLMKHFTSSYSASRGALLEAWKMYKKRREWLASSFCQPIYELFLAEAVAKGRVHAPGFFDDSIIRDAYCQAEWNGPTQGQLDPLKEVNAATKRVEEGFSTRTRETIELTGSDFFKNNHLREIEEKARKESGLLEVATQVVVEPQKEVEEKDED